MCVCMNVSMYACIKFHGNPSREPRSSTLTNEKTDVYDETSLFLYDHSSSTSLTNFSNSVLKAYIILRTANDAKPRLMPHDISPNLSIYATERTIQNCTVSKVQCMSACSMPCTHRRGSKMEGIMGNATTLPLHSRERSIVTLIEKARLTTRDVLDGYREHKISGHTRLRTPDRPFCF